MKDVNIYIYTEYSGNLKSGTGKYHVILETLVNTKNGKEPATTKDMDICEDITRNRLELLAVNVALEHMIKSSRIIIHTASDYVINAFIQGWVTQWAGNEWKAGKKEIKHADLWKSIVEKLKQHEYTFMKADQTPYMKTQALELKNYKVVER